MGKRVNENAQQRKEDWEASDETNEEISTEPSGTFQRASDEVMKYRRTIRRSDQRKSLTPSYSTPSTSSNPFANVVLTSSAPAATASTSNPFANLTLPPPPPPAPAPPPAANSRRQELNQAFRAHISHLRKNHMGEDWTSSMQQYKEYYRAITNTAAPSIAATPVTAPVAAAPIAASGTAVEPTLATTPESSETVKATTPESSETVKANPDSKGIKFHRVEIAKVFRYQDPKFLPGIKGELSLEFDGNSKLVVLRDIYTGKVLFNVALPADIKYVETTNAKGVTVKTIQFLAKEKVDEPPSLVRLQTLQECLEPLYNAMIELAAKK